MWATLEGFISLDLALSKFGSIWSKVEVINFSKYYSLIFIDLGQIFPLKPTLIYQTYNSKTTVFFSPLWSLSLISHITKYEYIGKMLKPFVFFLFSHLIYPISFILFIYSPTSNSLDAHKLMVCPCEKSPLHTPHWVVREVQVRWDKDIIILV